MKAMCKYREVRFDEWPYIAMYGVSGKTQRHINESVWGARLSARVFLVMQRSK